MGNKRQPAFVGVILGLGAVMCWVVGGTNQDYAWGRYVIGIGDSMPFTILVLILGSRRARNPATLVGARRLLDRVASVPSGMMLIYGLSSFVGAMVATGWDSLVVAGAVTGMVLTVLIWAAIDPASSRGQNPSPVP